MIEMTCEVLEDGGMRLAFSTEEDNYCEFNFDGLADLEGFLMECHEMGVLAMQQGKRLNS